MFRSRGFSIVTAIFLLVILAALGAFMLNVSSGQHLALAKDVDGSRAVQAARLGAEWGAYQVLRNPSGTFISDAANGCNQKLYHSATTANATHTTTLGALAFQDLSGLDGLPGFTVTVRCGSGGAANVYSEAGASFRVYQIVATACNRPDLASATGGCPNSSAGENYIERQVQLTVSQ